jgi:hypothetical protein
MNPKKIQPLAERGAQTVEEALAAIRAAAARVAFKRRQLAEGNAAKKGAQDLPNQQASHEPPRRRR